MTYKGISTKGGYPEIMGARKWVSSSAYVLAWSVIGRLMIHASSVLFPLTMLTIHSLSVYHGLAAASAANWFNKGSAMYYNFPVTMHVKDL